MITEVESGNGSGLIILRTASPGSLNQNLNFVSRVGNGSFAFSDLVRDVQRFNSGERVALKDSQVLSDREKSGFVSLRAVLNAWKCTT